MGSSGGKAERTSVRIVEAGRLLATERGLTAISVSEVAAAAGLSKSGLLFRCRSATDLQVDIAMAWREELEETACAAAAGRGIGGVWAFCREWLSRPGLRGAPVDVLRGDPVRDRSFTDIRPRRTVTGTLRIALRAIEGALGRAARAGELAAATEASGIAFDVLALLLSWSWAARVLGVERALEMIATRVWSMLAALCVDAASTLPPLESELRVLRGAPPPVLEEERDAGTPLPDYDNAPF